MLMHVNDRAAADWEELARREPYFPVHAHEGLAGAAGSIGTAEFFASGETDFAALLDATTSVLGRDINLASAMDFGCGAGRLTLPLARRAEQVVACDIAPTMLVHARQNAEHAGLPNIRFMMADECLQLPHASFDFVVSLLVLQYIFPSPGYALLRTLVGLLAPGGVAAVHVVLQTRGGELRRLAQFTHGRSRLARRTMSPPREPAYAHVHKYDVQLLRRETDASGGRIAARLPLHTSGADGAVLIIEKRRG